jgi:hypothetical protein
MSTEWKKFHAIHWNVTSPHQLGAEPLFLQSLCQVMYMGLQVSFKDPENGVLHKFSP